MPVLTTSRAACWYLYVITAGDFCKIGITNHLRARLKQYHVHCPLDVLMYFVQEAAPKDARVLEREVHRRLSALKTKGEWFRCTGENAAAAIGKVRKELGFPRYAGGVIWSGESWPAIRREQPRITV